MDVHNAVLMAITCSVHLVEILRPSMGVAL